MRTGSSATIGVQFTYELAKRITDFARTSNKSKNWHIRQACILYLAANGIDTSDSDNPEGRGVRSDLKKRLPKEQEQERYGI